MSRVVTAATGEVRSPGPSDPWPKILPLTASWLALVGRFLSLQQGVLEDKCSLLLIDVGLSLISPPVNFIFEWHVLR